MSTRTITVFGEGSTQFRSDRAVIRFQTSGGGEQPIDAYQTVADHTMTLRESLLDIGCDRSQLKITDCTVEHRSNLFDPPADAPQYTGTESLIVRGDTEIIRERLVAGIETGAEVVEVQSVVSDEQRSKLRSQALAEATTEARTHAQAIADAEDVELGKLIDIDEESSSGMQSIVDDALEHPGPDNLVPGSIEISARVAATFEMLN